jgi:hypothetical protein
LDANRAFLKWQVKPSGKAAAYTPYRPPVPSHYLVSGNGDRLKPSANCMLRGGT